MADVVKFPQKTTVDPLEDEAAKAKDLKDLKRKARNEDLVERFKNGESLAAVTPEQTWWPPRPIIKKDPKEIERLYGKDRQGGPSDETK